MTKTLLLGSALLLVAGCMPSLDSTEPAGRVYWLETMELSKQADLRLELSVVPGLDSDRIWVLQADQRLNYYAGAYWPDTLRPLLQSIMSRSLNSQPAATVQLHVTLERFFAVERAGLPPLVEVRARFELTGPERKPGASCVFQSSTVAASERLGDIVAAHQQLLNALTESANRFAGSSGSQQACL